MRIIFQYDNEILSNLQSNTNNYQSKIVIEVNNNQYDQKQLLNNIQGGLKKILYTKEMSEPDIYDNEQDGQNQNDGARSPQKLPTIREDENEATGALSSIKKGDNLNNIREDDTEQTQDALEMSENILEYVQSYGDMQLLRDHYRARLDKIQKKSVSENMDNFIDQLQKTIFKNDIKKNGSALSLNEVIINKSITREQKYIKTFFKRYSANDLLTLYFKSILDDLNIKQIQPRGDHDIIINNNEQQDDYENLDEFQQFITYDILGQISNEEQLNEEQLNEEQSNGEQSNEEQSNEEQ